MVSVDLNLNLEKKSGHFSSINCAHSPFTWGGGVPFKFNSSFILFDITFLFRVEDLFQMISFSYMKK